MSGEKTIVELREIYSCLVLSKNIAAKAFITFIMSSGMDRKDIMNLTVDDLLNACHINTIDQLLRISPDKKIPMWVDETEDTYKLNFSSPESLFYIFLHLKERSCKTDLQRTDKLFDISPSTLDDNFRISEHLTEIGSHYPYSREGEVVSHKFTAKSLQKFFIKQYDEHSPDYANGKQLKFQGKKYSQYKAKLFTLFTKGLPKDDPYYKEFSNNWIRLKMDYQNVLSCITAKNYDTVSPSWKIKIDDEFQELLNNRTIPEKKSYTNIEVNKIVFNYIEYISNDEIPDDVHLNQIIQFAIVDNKIGYFKDSKDYLDNLLLKPYLKEDLEAIISEPIEIPILTQTQMIIDLISILDENDIFDKYPINKYKLGFNIEDAIDFYGDQGKQRFITVEKLLEVCFDTMMNGE